MFSETEKSAKIQNRGTILASLIGGGFSVIVVVISVLGYSNLNNSNNALSNDNEKLLSQIVQISLELDNVKKDCEDVKQQVRDLELSAQTQSDDVLNNSVAKETSKRDEKLEENIRPAKCQILSQLSYTDFSYSESNGKWDVPTVENIGENDKNKKTYMSAVKLKLNYTEKIYPEDGDVQQMTLSYDLKNKYSKLSFYLYTNDSQYFAPSTITICDNNDNVLATINALTSNTPTVFKEIPLVNVDTLKFVITSPVPYRDIANFDSRREFYFSDATLS